MAPTSLPGTTDRRLASLLTLFADNATIAISGSRIAKEIGVSRSTVWRWVERLREVGVRVKGKPNTGYFLERVPDILTPDMLRERLKGSMFAKRIHHFFRTDSTNRVAMELGYAGEPEGNVPSAKSMRGPQGVWIQNGRLYVADTQNNRVLIFNQIPATNGASADVVLGQPDFTTFVEPDLTQQKTEVTAKVLLNPVAVTSDGIHLFVTDLGYNRILVGLAN